MNSADTLNPKEYNVASYRSAAHHFTYKGAKHRIGIAVYNSTNDVYEVRSNSAKTAIWRALNVIRISHPELMRRTLKQLAKKKWEALMTCSNQKEESFHYIELRFPWLTND